MMSPEFLVSIASITGFLWVSAAATGFLGEIDRFLLTVVDAFFRLHIIAQKFFVGVLCLLSGAAVRPAFRH